MIKSLALIAHDNQKDKLVDFAKENFQALSVLKLYATGTTAKRLEQIGLKNITAVASGPLGGDLQIGSLIVDNKIDGMIFLWDPLSPQPHDVDVKALLRIAVLKNIFLASNLKSAQSFIQHL